MDAPTEIPGALTQSVVQEITERPRGHPNQQRYDDPPAHVLCNRLIKRLSCNMAKAARWFSLRPLRIFSAILAVKSFRFRFLKKSKALNRKER
jgi:hypothetical protein